MTIRMGIRSDSHLLGSCLLALTTLASPFASGLAHASLVLGVVPGAPADALMILLPPRATETVRKDLEACERLEEESNADRQSAERLLGEVKAQITVCSSEIDVIKARVKLAKDQKNATEQSDLEQQVKAKELQLKVLRAREDMRNAEVGLADARRKAAQTLAGFLKKEIELIAKRDDLVQMSTAREQAADPDVLARLQNDTRDLERRCLQLLKDVAEKQKDTAEREAGLLDKRLKVHEAQLALLEGPKK